MYVLVKRDTWILTFYSISCRAYSVRTFHFHPHLLRDVIIDTKRSQSDLYLGN